MFGSAASGMPGAAHPAEGSQRHRRPGAVIRPDRRDVERRESAGDGLGPDPARDLGVVVERQEGDDRERRDAAHRLDRDDELLEVEERLDHEQVDAAPLEHLRLRRVQRAVLGRVEHLELAERADRPGDEDVPPGDLARLAGEPDGGGVDLLERRRRGARARACAGSRRRCSSRSAPPRRRCSSRAPRRRSRAREGSPPPGSAGRGTACEISAPVPPSATIGAPVRRRSRNRLTPSTVVPVVARGSGEAGLPPGPAPTRPSPKRREPAPLAPEQRPVSEASSACRDARAYHPSGVIPRRRMQPLRRRGGGLRRPGLHSVGRRK